MSHDIQIRSAQGMPDVADPLGTHTSSGEPMEPIFSRIHRLLSGRYLWAIGLGLVLGCIGGFAGYKSTEPLWTSTGQVQIKMNRDVVLSNSPENQSSQSPDVAKETQIALMRSPHIIEMVFTKPEWTHLKRPLTDENLADFMKKLTIVSQGRSEIINVSFVDADPAAASAAVKGVLGSYNGTYVEGEVKAFDEKKLKLQRRRDVLAEERANKRLKITSMASRSVGADDLRTVHQAMVVELTKLQTAIDDLNMTIRALDTGGPATQPVKKDPKDMRVEDIEMIDGLMRELRHELAAAVRDAKLKLTTLGPNNPRYQEASRMVDLKKDEVENYAIEWRKAASAQPLAPRPGEAAPVTPAQLKARLEAYNKDYKVLVDKTLSLGQEMLEIEKLKREVADADAEIGEIDHRISQLQLEQNPSKRIEIISFGERPMMTKDSRAAYAAAGSMAGLGMGFALIMLLGLMDRSFRSLEDARKSVRMPLLGILPNLPENLADPEQAATAAHCVHQIRTLLQLTGGREKRVFAITSPAAGTGKTSLTLSLGVSFAASNCRTLVIDCDIVGGGLTARVDTIVRRKIGEILRRHDLVNIEQLNEALKLAENSKKKLGEVLVELGYVAEADITQALQMQLHDPVGMLDAIDGKNVVDCIAETGIERLCILPLGSAMPTDVSKLSPAIIRSILDQARQHFDVILIDTGPIPGSLEASVAAAAADGVVLVVSRGEHRPMAERSIQHLLDIGAKLAGMVFNRAEGRDMDLATTTKRLSSFDRRSGKSVSVQRQAQQADSKGFGPMALAVATKTPAAGNGTRPRT
jgi:succinoglycan biosynthesis transport protein ExoP